MSICNFLKKLISSVLLSDTIISQITERLHAKLSFSQNGEDMIIPLFFPDDYKGTYVDVGAHHPTRFSNTYHLYQQGWHGINIDPLPNSMTIFNKERPRDTNLELAVGLESQGCYYYAFKESAYNTLSSERATSVIKNNYSDLLEKKLSKRNLLSQF